MADAVLDNLELDLRDHKAKGKSGGKNVKKVSDKTINIAGPSSGEGNDCNGKTPNSTAGQDVDNDAKFNNQAVEKLSATMSIFMEKIMDEDAPASPQEHPNPTQMDDTPLALPKPPEGTTSALSGDDMLTEMAAYYDTTESVSNKIDDK